MGGGRCLCLLLCPSPLCSPLQFWGLGVLLWPFPLNHLGSRWGYVLSAVSLFAGGGGGQGLAVPGSRWGFLGGGGGLCVRDLV